MAARKKAARKEEVPALDTLDEFMAGEARDWVCRFVLRQPPNAGLWDGCAMELRAAVRELAERGLR